MKQEVTRLQEMLNRLDFKRKVCIRIIVTCEGQSSFTKMSPNIRVTKMPTPHECTDKDLLHRIIYI